MGTARRPRAQASLDIDRQGNPPRPVIASQLAATTRCLFVFCSRHRLHAFPSSVATARKEEGDNPSRVQPDWDEATGPVGYRPQSKTPAPQSKPVTHASRLVTQNAPSVHSGLSGESRPQGQLNYDCTPIRGACVP
jgi:hypothetical protein